MEVIGQENEKKTVNVVDDGKEFLIIPHNGNQQFISTSVQQWREEYEE